MDDTSCYCTVVACIQNDDERSETEQFVQKFLLDLRLPFSIFEFDENSVTENELTHDIVSGILKRNPQSLAICFFLKEDTDYGCAASSHLKSSPWQLDHVIESSVTQRPQKIARQEFYRCSNKIPLMSVSSVHYGNEHVRFHIYVKKFYEMKKFYEAITDRKAVNCGSNFCFLTISSEDGLDVQIGLKKNPEVYPLRSTSFKLKFRFQSISPLFKYLASSQNSTKANYILQDPDGNDIIIERTYIKNSCINYQQFESTDNLDENNNFEGISKENRRRRHIWRRFDDSEHGYFPQEALSIADSFLNNHEEESETETHRRNDYITFV